jgi:hypothetical protein
MVVPIALLGLWPGGAIGLVLVGLWGVGITGVAMHRRAQSAR